MFLAACKKIKNILIQKYLKETKSYFGTCSTVPSYIFTKQEIVSFIKFEKRLDLEDYLYRSSFVATPPERYWHAGLFEPPPSVPVDKRQITFTIHRINLRKEYAENISINILKHKCFFDFSEIITLSDLKEEDLAFLDSFDKVYILKEKGLYVNLQSVYFVLDKLFPNKGSYFKKKYYPFFVSAFLFFLDKIHSLPNQKEIVEVFPADLGFLLPMFSLTFIERKDFMNFIERSMIKIGFEALKISELADMFVKDFISFFRETSNSNSEFSPSLEKFLLSIFYYALLTYLIAYTNKVIEKKMLLAKYNVPLKARFGFRIVKDNYIALYEPEAKLIITAKYQERNVLSVVFEECEERIKKRKYHRQFFVKPDLSILSSPFSEEDFKKVTITVDLKGAEPYICNEGFLYTFNNQDAFIKTILSITGDSATKDKLYIFAIKNILATKPV